jgi:alkanesulfonate monooxygenase SsuD/methylene tetrahydromethanopterin reductase-like flavin-dependent oxidoreductase (luciferase family)
MASEKIRIGLTLPNRGVVFGATTVGEMLDLGERADAAGWDSVWVGDSVFGKPRLDAIALLGALTARTKRVRLGAACFASTPLRNPLLLAYQWACLDLMSGGRTVFVACKGQATGGGEFYKEFQLLGIDPKTRMRRMEEAIEIIRLTSAREHVDYDGQFTSFRDLTILPRPVQQPIPIWVVANPGNFKTFTDIESAFRRVAKYGDGWMTLLKTPEEIEKSLERIRRYAREAGRILPPGFEVALYYNININENREAAFEESSRFLDAYYAPLSFSRELIERSSALGSPAECIENIRRFAAAGVTTITLRPTAYNQEHQFKRITQEVLPAFI